MYVVWWLFSHCNAIVDESSNGMKEFVRMRKSIAVYKIIKKYFLQQSKKLHENRKMNKIMRWDDEMRLWDDMMRWDYEIRSWDEIIRGDHGMRSWNQIMRWDDEIRSWYHEIRLWNEMVRWDDEIRSCHYGLVVSAPVWDGTGCEFDSWQCRIYNYISHVQRAYDYLGSFGVLWVHMAWHKNCVKNEIIRWDYEMRSWDHIMRWYHDMKGNGINMSSF